jgi:mono/diheme cytochrome c family protein
VKQISFLVVGSVIAFANAPAQAQDFTAGKTPAQLFSSDCAECHRSPNGLARGRDVRSLAGFLREHYTTKSETAGSLAAYVSGFSGGGPADARNRGTPPANAATGDRRIRRDVEPSPASEDSRTNSKPV